MSERSLQEIVRESQSSPPSVRSRDEREPIPQEIVEEVRETHEEPKE